MGIRICPICNGKVSESRNICIHCGYVFPNSKQCPDCGEMVNVDIKECPNCGHLFNVVSQDYSYVGMETSESDTVDAASNDHPENMQSANKKNNYALEPETADDLDTDGNDEKTINLTASEKVQCEGTAESAVVCPYCGSTTLIQAGIDNYICAVCRGKFLDASVEEYHPNARSDDRSTEAEVSSTDKVQFLVTALQCPSCKCLNETDAKFCLSCGNELDGKAISAVRCPSCGALNEEESAFCLTCGAKIAPQSLPISSTYKQNGYKHLQTESSITKKSSASQKEQINRKIKTVCIVTAILLVVWIAVFFVAVKFKFDIPYQKYKDAETLMENGQYQEAAEAFAALGDYKDAALQIENCKIGMYGEETYYLMKEINIGDTYSFGSYEQNNDLGYGPETIEWIVLDKSDTKILLISKYVLDCKTYNKSYESVTWESSSIRKWLNETFLNEAFSSDQIKKIWTASVSPDENPDYNTNAGETTEDKVFMLSIAEAEKYFSLDSDRKCEPTDYAKSKSVYVNGEGACRWWLRSPGNGSNTAAEVDLDGSIYFAGSNVNNFNIGVRPLIWIDLSVDP